MSAYDDAVVYLDAEIHPRCDYDIYSDMRDIVDEMENENEKVRELLSMALIVAGFKGRQYLDAYLKEEESTTLLQKLKSLGIEVKP